MIVFDHITYAAVITIASGDLPSARLTVTLTPADSVLTNNGEAKPLRECTLLELEQYAARVEASVAETLHAVRLAELDAETTTQVHITLLPDKIDGVDTEWEELAIVLPAKEVEPDADAAEAEDAEDEAPTATSGQESEGGTMVEAPATPVAEMAAEQVADSEVTTAEPDVTVDEAQPVHEEREAGEPAPVVAAVETGERVAGRRRGLEESTWMAVDILIAEKALIAAQAHAQSSPDKEVAGVLVGPAPEKQPNGRYVVEVTDTIIARHTRMHGASVTYTPESWRYLNDELARRYPDETAVMVGWYHTHPGFGIFLSGMDQFIHRNFFTQRWHIALVLDPLVRRMGFFCWDQSQREVRAADFAWPPWARGSW